jgi:Protein of unknown function (DUF4238)
MADKKKQHYIPRFYLKNFSRKDSEKSIGIFNIASSRFIPIGSLKDQAYKNYFYGRDLKIENALEILEDASAKIIQSILTQKYIPYRGSQDYSTLLFFVVFLNERTPCKVKQLNEFTDKFVKTTFYEWLSVKKISLPPDLDNLKITMKNTIRAALRNAALHLDLVFDLGLKVVLNKTQEPFITSDHPVVFYNQFLELRKQYGSNTGLACKGLEIFLPISPQHLLIFFDRDVYKVGNKNDAVIDIANIDDVRALNSLQCISADEHLYFNEEVSEQQIKLLLCRSIRQERRKAKANVDQYRGFKDDGRKSIILHSYKSDIKCSLSLSFIHTLKKAKKYIVGDKVLHMRDPEIFQLHQTFVEQVKKGTYCASDFHRFINDVLESGQ